MLSPRPVPPHLLVVAGVDLMEGVKDLLEMRFGNPSARVFHRDLDPPGATFVGRPCRAGQLKPHDDVSLLGELHGVANQVREDLPQAVGVSLQPEVIGQR